MSDTSVDPSDPAVQAARLYVEALRAEGRVQVLDLDALCRAHPELEHELRDVHEGWQRLANLVPGSVAERLREQYGPEADPHVSLHGTAEPESGFSSAVLESLAGRKGSFHRYQLEGEIARGGMGAILRVWDGDLRRHLAMKVVLGKGAAETSGATPQVPATTLARFLEEAQVTGQLDHPGIVPVHELGLDADGRVYFTMKLVKGRTLKEVFGELSRGERGWSQTRVLGLILKVCEALSYAHDKGVIHRDLKPANVMVGEFGEVYVMDWGLAKILGRADRRDLRVQPLAGRTTGEIHSDRKDRAAQTPESPIVTMDGAVVGTPAYMSPEQAQGKVSEMGPASDVYAVGAMLYHLLAGHMPYVPPGAVLDNHSVWRCVRDGPPRSVHELAPSVPAELVAICERAMAREKSARYANTSELAEDLAAYLEGRVVRAYETGAWAEARKWMRRNRPLAAALAAALVLAAGGLGGIAYVQAQGRRVAERERTRADVKADEAAHHAREAQRNEAEARAQREGVLSLSAQKDLDDLVAEAEVLWPAHPEMIPAYEDWLRRAQELIDGRPADAARGVKGRPSLAEHRVKLAELRAGAVPLTEEQIAADRESDPRLAELLAVQAELTWYSRMLEIEPWPSEAEVEARLALESLPSDAAALNGLAWSLVDPTQPAYGQELRALCLARRALAAASGVEQGAEVRDTLAWALFALGRFDEALAEAHTALSEPHDAVLEAALEESAARLEQSVASWRGGEAARRREQRDALAAEVAELSALTGEFEYPDSESEWWDRQLSKLVADLEALRDPQAGLIGDTLAEPFGWGVEKRRGFALAIAERSADGAQAQRLWIDAIAAIESSPEYGGLELTPQLGLLPIGMDPSSRLFEFAHLQTGDPAVRLASGELALTEATGLVFVLIPGGTFWMGAQSEDPDLPNYDPRAEDDEFPVHEVELGPYFLSKYEMTQGQWERIAGDNPSLYQPPNGYTPSLRHPVERVSWTDCQALLERLGLSLPSEGQWEHSARGGTSTAWWTGQERESLRGKVNIADQTAKRSGASWDGIDDWPDYEDGSVVHAEIGSYPANGFGLHEVAGNLWEWCLDGYDKAFYAQELGRDPAAPWSGSAPRVFRGGSYGFDASLTRSAMRYYREPDFRDGGCGVRPARAITP